MLRLQFYFAAVRRYVPPIGSTEAIPGKAAETIMRANPFGTSGCKLLGVNRGKKWTVCNESLPSDSSLNGIYPCSSKGSDGPTGRTMAMTSRICWAASTRPSEDVILANRSNNYRSAASAYSAGCAPGFQTFGFSGKLFSQRAHQRRAICEGA